MAGSIDGVGGVTGLTGNFETDLNIVMAARQANTEQSIQGKLAAMKTNTDQMKRLNDLSSKLSGLAASMKTSKPDDKLGDKSGAAINEIKTLLEGAGLNLNDVFPKGIDKNTTLNELTTAASSMRQSADSIGSTSQTEQLMMQQAMNKFSQISDQWSNMMSKIAQAKQTPISNMR